MSYLRRFGRVWLLLCSAAVVGGLAFGETGPQNSPPQNPQNPGQSQNPPSLPSGQNPTAQMNAQHKTDDEIAKLRKSLTDDSDNGAKKSVLKLDPIPKKRVELGSTLTFRAVARTPSVSSPSVITYSLYGAPDGATIDSQTGAVTWDPLVAGIYTFYVVASDDAQPRRTGNTPVTVEVRRRLVPFGYSFFTGARALIDYRLAVARTGFVPGVGPPASGAQRAAGLPIVTRIDPRDGFGPAGTNASGRAPNLNDSPNPAGTPVRYNSPPPPSDTDRAGTGNAAVGQSNNGQANSSGQTGNAAAGGAGGQSPNSQTNGGQGAGGQNANPGATSGQGNYPNAGPGGSQVTGAPANPSPLLPPPGSGQSDDNRASADALRYFVGPFDMLGLNVFVPAPDRYQLGPGDILTVRYSSPALEASEVDVKIDQRGYVTIPLSGRKIVVRGQTLEMAEQLMRREMRKDVRNAQLTLALKALRTMSITVLGDAYLPGSYQVPAVATLFNALYMFGGPDNNGSLRHIELRRTDGSTLNFDLYKFLVSGDASQDVPLQPGDTIWIPPAGARVTVDGEVARPGIYEAAKGERLRNLIAFAGGPRATGVAQRVSLQTVEPSVGRQLRDVDLSAVGTPEGDPAVFDGDVATVAAVRDVYTNAITLEGAVDQPGQYAAIPGTTVADLIAKARGLLPDAYTTRADLFRRNPDRTETLVPIDLERALARTADANVALRPYDRLVVYQIGDVKWIGDRQVVVQGAVQRPGTYTRADNMRVFDLLLQAGGLNPDAYTGDMFLQRTNPDGTLGPLVKVDYSRMNAGDPAMNFALQDRDVLIVQTVTEARFTPDDRVRILGFVQSPGPYLRGSNMRLSDLIKLSGGLLPNAGDSAEITNARVPVGSAHQRVILTDALAGANDPALKDGDLVTIPGRSDIQLTPRKVFVTGAVKRPGPYPINGTTDRLTDLISRAGGFAPNAFPEGAQFFRDPKELGTVSQERVSPRIRQELEVIDRQSYMRELAKSQIDKAKFIKSVNGGPAIALPGVSVSDTPVDIPASVISQSTVTPARPLSDADLQPGGNFAVDLPKAMKRRGSANNIVLLDGDIVVIPFRPTTVSVVGAVVVPSAVLFEPHQTIDYYVKRSGGYSTDAARDEILLIRYRGLVVKPIGSTIVELGDIIWVPTKVMAERLTDKTAEISAVSQNVLSGAIMLALVLSLIR